MFDKLKDESPDSTILLHCSAGCGRTGSLIAINIFRELLKSKKLKDLSIKQMVIELRKQRVCMVQTPGQYLFLHKVIAHYCRQYLAEDSVPEDMAPLPKKLQIEILPLATTSKLPSPSKSPAALAIQKALGAALAAPFQFSTLLPPISPLLIENGLCPHTQENGGGKAKSHPKRLSPNSKGSYPPKVPPKTPPKSPPKSPIKPQSPPKPPPKPASPTKIHSPYSNQNSDCEFV